MTDEDRVKYAEEKLGATIDPNQDWVLTDECNVTINADASLEGISMVAVLDGTPYAGITKSWPLHLRAVTQRPVSHSVHRKAQSISMPPA